MKASITTNPPRIGAVPVPSRLTHLPPPPITKDDSKTMITAKTYRTADRFALDLVAHGVSLTKTARASKRVRKLNMKNRNRLGVASHA